MLEAEAAPNLATETKYSLVKNTIVRAEKPVEDVEELIQADVHTAGDTTDEEEASEDESDEDNDKSSKSVKFNEQNTLVADVGVTEKECYTFTNINIFSAANLEKNFSSPKHSPCRLLCSAMLCFLSQSHCFEKTLTQANNMIVKV